MDSNFENAFSDFIDRREYDDAESALFDIVRAAFLAGWKSAGGEPPTSRPVFALLDRDRSLSSSVSGLFGPEIFYLFIDGKRSRRCIYTA